MRGEYQHSIDAKGRLIFPVKLREELGERFVVSKGLDNCLWVHSSDEWDRFLEDIAMQPRAKGRKLERFFASNYECDPDGQGRVLIPQVLREYAQLEKDVTIVCISRRVEIWDSEKWRRVSDIPSDEAAELMDELGL